MRIRERTADGTTRAGTMVEADPVRFRYEFPPSPELVDLQSRGRRRLAGTDHRRACRPPLARRDAAAGQGARNGRRLAHPRRRRLQHLLFLPDTEVELTLVGNEKLADIQLKVHPGSAPALEATG